MAQTAEKAKRGKDREQPISPISSSMSKDLLLKAFHDKWYAPNNAILVIVGDVDPRSTLVEVKALFGNIPARKLPQRSEIRLPNLRANHRSRYSK